MHRFRDQNGVDWAAFLDPRSVVKRGRSTFASLTVLAPMPSYRQGIKIVAALSALKPNTACEVE